MLIIRKITAISIALLVFISSITSVAEAKEILLRFGGQTPMDHIATTAIIDIAKEIQEKTNGEIKVRTYPASQLGDYVLMYEELMRGDLDIALITAPTHVDSRFGLAFMSYLVSGWEEANRIYAKDGWLAKTMKDAHKEKGVEFLDFFMEGMSGIGTTKEPKNVLDPNVSKGVVLRASPSEFSRYLVEAMNYQAVTIPYAELYVSLQTGVADGWVGGNPSYNYTGFRDVVKYYYHINYEATTEQFLASSKTWEKLTSEQQKIIREAVAKQRKNSFKVAAAEDEKYMKLMKESGIKVFTYTEAEQAPLAQHIRKTVWPKMKSSLGDKIFNELIKEFNIKL